MTSPGKGMTKEQLRTYHREWKRARPGYDRNRWLKRLYGITEKDYSEFLCHQNGVCAICREQPTKTLDVDHNHVTRKVRGLVCNRCNTGMGNFRDNPVYLRAAANYLESTDG